MACARTAAWGPRRAFAFVSFGRFAERGHNHDETNAQRKDYGTDCTDCGRRPSNRSQDTAPPPASTDTTDAFALTVYLLTIIIPTVGSCVVCCLLALLIVAMQRKLMQKSSNAAAGGRSYEAARARAEARRAAQAANGTVTLAASAVPVAVVVSDAKV